MLLIIHIVICTLIGAAILQRKGKVNDQCLEILREAWLVGKTPEPTREENQAGRTDDENWILFARF